MTRANASADFEEVLMEFVYENENPTPEALAEWVRRYPQYEAELMDLAMDWLYMTLPRSARSTRISKSKIIQVAMKALQSVPDAPKCPFDNGLKIPNQPWVVPTLHGNSDFSACKTYITQQIIKDAIKRVYRRETIPDHLNVILPSLLRYLDKYNKRNWDPSVQRMIDELFPYVKFHSVRHLFSNLNFHFYANVPTDPELSEADGQYLLDLVHELMQ
jgi:hypothetical protein